MVPRIIRAVWLSGVVAALVVPAGCTNTEVLNSGVGATVVEFELTNPQVPFRTARFDVFQIQIEPLDQDAADALQGAPLGMFNSQSFDDTSNSGITVFYDDPPNQQRNVSLPQGQYKLTQIDLINVRFTGSTPPGCTVTVPNLPLYFTTNIGDFLPPTIITLRPDAVGGLKLVFNGAQFLQVCQDALFQSGGCGQILGEPVLSFVYARANEFLSLQTSP